MGARINKYAALTMALFPEKSNNALFQAEGQP
jgi:hypothetical protein